MQPFTQRKQALHDLLAGTVVVRANDSRKISIMASLLVLFFAVMTPALAMFATVGHPFFQQHILKAQLDRGMQIGTAATLAVSRYYRHNGSTSRRDRRCGWRYRADLRMWQEVALDPQNGAILLTFSDTVRKGISNKHLSFTPTLEADHSISWKCSSADIETRYLPVACK